MRKFLVTAVVALCSAGVLAGCGSSGSSSGSASKGTAVSAADLSYAKAQVAKYSGVPAFVPRGTPLDVASLKGKTIYSIPITTQIPFYKYGEAAMAAAAHKAGLKYVTFPAQGTLSDFQQGFAQAINAKAAAIILNGPLPEDLAPQLRQAKAAGIPVVAAHEEDPSLPTPAGVAAVAAGYFYQAARLMVDEAIANLNGQPVHALAISSNDTRPSPGMIAAIKSELAAHCGPKCTLTTTNVPVADWATGIQPAVQSALVADGSINTILPIYDSMTQYVDPAIRQGGVGRSISVYSYNGTPAITALLETGNTYLKADVGESPTWIGLLTMDQVLRLLLHKPVLSDPAPAAPLRIFTTANIKQAGTPPVSGGGFGSAATTGYYKLWGLK
jgi:ribose transport system substrate-binding protein